MITSLVTHSCIASPWFSPWKHTIIHGRGNLGVIWLLPCIWAKSDFTAWSSFDVYALPSARSLSFCSRHRVRKFYLTPHYSFPWRIWNGRMRSPLVCLSWANVIPTHRKRKRTWENPLSCQSCCSKCNLLALNLFRGIENAFIQRPPELKIISQK